MSRVIFRKIVIKIEPGGLSPGSQHGLTDKCKQPGETPPAVLLPKGYFAHPIDQVSCSEEHSRFLKTFLFVFVS